jgi:hypothetical protein
VSYNDHRRADLTATWAVLGERPAPLGPSEAARLGLPCLVRPWSGVASRRSVRGPRTGMALWSRRLSDIRAMPSGNWDQRCATSGLIAAVLFALALPCP